jgi:type I restriction enzyme S subunit
LTARGFAPVTAPPNIRYIDISSVSPGTVNEIRTLAFANAPGRARRRVARGDIIWSTVRPNRRSYALLLHVEPDTIASTGFAVLRAKTVPWSYLYSAVTTNEFVAYLEGRARGSAYPAVSAFDFEDVTLLVPPIELLSQFHLHTRPMLELVATLRQQDKILGAARDLLIPKMMSGQIDLTAGEREVERIADQAAAK